MSGLRLFPPVEGRATPTTFDLRTSAESESVFTAEDGYVGERPKYGESTMGIELRVTALPALLATKLMDAIREVERELRASGKVESLSFQEKYVE